MPVTPGQGQSGVTAKKQAGLGGVLRQNIAILKAAGGKPLDRYPYWHFDLNSGCGWNHQANVPGSPLVAVEAFREMGVRYWAHFVDSKQTYIDQLAARDEFDPECCYIHPGDNADFVGAIPDIIRGRGERPEYATGTVYCDPNGGDIPFDGLGQVFDECKRLDVVVNVAANGAFKRGGLPPLPIDDFSRIFRKQHWLIRRTDASDPLQWVMLIGRNMKTRDYSSLGFFDLYSGQGQVIARELQTTRDQRASEGGHQLALGLR